MKKTMYICDKCKKEFKADELESYWPLEFGRCYKRSNSFSYISGKVYVDLCSECDKLFRKRIDDFMESLGEEFNSQK